MRKPRRLALPGRTVRLRFTALYAVLFLLSGVGLLAITNLLAGGTRRPSPRPAEPAASSPASRPPRSSSASSRPSCRRCRRRSRASS